MEREVTGVRRAYQGREDPEAVEGDMDYLVEMGRVDHLDLEDLLVHQDLQGSEPKVKRDVQ